MQSRDSGVQSGVVPAKKDAVVKFPWMGSHHSPERFPNPYNIRCAWRDKV